MLNDKFAGIDRSEVKEKMFQEVFYSKVMGGTNMAYQEEFKLSFPNVFKLIMDFRRKHRQGERHLSHELMTLESEIIHQALRRMYKMGLCVINIHDAIVVLNIPQNNQTSIDEIIEVLHSEIQSIGLLGKIKVETLRPIVNSDGQT